MAVDPHRFDKLITQTERSAARMKEQVNNYRDAKTPDAEK